MTLPSISSSIRRLSYGENADPARDWMMLLAFFGIALAGCIGWNVWAFDTAASGGVIGNVPAEVAPIFEQASLDAVHAFFEARREEEARYLTGVYQFADPGL